MRGRFAYLAAALLLCCQACHWRGLDYDYSYFAEFDVVFDWSDSELAESRPDGRTAAFYPVGEGAPVVRMSNSDTLRVKLEAGDYNAVFFNETFDDFDYICFDGRGAFSGLTARMKDGATRLGDDALCVETIRSFAVGDNLPRVIVVRPEDVLSTVDLRVNVAGGEYIASAGAYVCGLAGGYEFSSGSAVGSAVYKCGLTEGGLADDGVGSWSGEFRSFGLPEGFTEQDCEVVFRAVLADGSAFEALRKPDKIAVGRDAGGGSVISIEVTEPINIEAIPNVGGDGGWMVDIGGWDEENVPVGL